MTLADYPRTLIYQPGLEYKLTSGVGLGDLLAGRLGDAITLSLVGDWGGEAGAVTDREEGDNFDLGDNRLPFPDLYWGNKLRLNNCYIFTTHHTAVSYILFRQFLPCKSFHLFACPFDHSSTFILSVNHIITCE